MQTYIGYNFKPMGVERSLSSIKKRIAIILTGVFLVSSAFGIWISHRIDRAWELLERRTTELAIEARSRRSERTVLLAFAIPGNAWEDYAPAVTESNQILTPEVSRIISSTLRRAADEFDSEEKAFRILDSLRPQFEALQRGARRATAQSHRDWDSLESNAFGTQSDQSGKALIFAALLEARRLLRTGKGEESLDLFLATLQFGWDIGRNGTIVNEYLRMEVLGSVGDELARQIQEGKFNSQHLLVLERSLEVLDAEAIQPEVTLRNHLLMQGQMILHFSPSRNSLSRMSTLSGSGGPRADSIRPTWRHLYSTKLLRAAAFQSVDRACEQYARANAVGYSEIRRVQKDLRSEFEHSYNQFAETMLNDYDVLFKTQRRWISQLRLVRILAHYQASGEVLTLDDPLERTLRHQVTGSKLSIWTENVGRRELLFEFERQ
jgi:hypothetical protein